jgi:Fic family protein
VARLLTMLYLSLRAYDFKNVLVLDSYYLEHRLAYYSALNQAKTYQQQRAADLTPWIEYFVKGFFTVATALRKDVSVAQLPQDGRSTVRLTPDEMTILDFTKQVGVIDLEEALDILQVPKRTAQRRLSELIKKKLLRKQGSGKATRYVLATKKRK